MRIAVISPNTIRVTPYVSFYYDLLVSEGHFVDVFFPERDGRSFDKEHYYGFPSWKSKSNVINYVKYEKWLRLKISKKYDFVICLSMQMGFLLSRMLLGRFFKGNYIIDIRDYSYERFALFRLIERRVVKNAKACVISSPEFRSFLPKARYLVAHNISFEQKEHYSLTKNSGGRIVIAYVGALSYFSQCKRLIDLVSRDERFSFFFFGKGTDSEKIDNYIKTVNCDRIKYYGAFEPEEKKNIILSSDLLFNVYGNDDVRLKTALSNKLYDSLYYKKPLLNSVGTFMSRVSCRVSFEVDFSDGETLDKLYDWYTHLDVRSFDEVCDNLLSAFQKENAETKRLIVESLMRGAL